MGSLRTEPSRGNTSVPWEKMRIVSRISVVMRESGGGKGTMIGERLAMKGSHYLGQKVTSEFSVSDDVVGDTHWHNIRQPLYLMDHSICVGHLDPVFHTWDPVWSNHLVNLFMDLGWKMSKNITGKGHGDTGGFTKGQGLTMELYLAPGDTEGITHRFLVMSLF